MSASPTAREPYPPIADYALIGDCHSAALVSRAGSIDWCCLPRFDSGSAFGRILDWERGGYCAIAPDGGEYETSRDYLDGTLVLATTFRTAGGEARVYDAFAMRRGGRQDPYRQVLRIVEGVSGTVALRLRIAPRFDYGELAPWLRHCGPRLFSAVGGNDALVIYCDAELVRADDCDLEGAFTVAAGERVRLAIRYAPPETLDDAPQPPAAGELDTRLDETIAWWRRWSAQMRDDLPEGTALRRSAIVLKALTFAPTGALVAAPTTSLPEHQGGDRNWDYRYSWVRDSTLSVGALAAIGCVGEAEGFRRFVARSAAGSAGSLQIMYGVGGERRVPELTLAHLAGYRGARPARAGNAAARQTQLDVYGTILDLFWRWHGRGYRVDDDTWRFLAEVVEAAARRWTEPDSGFWEVRCDPRHFVHSKVLCWVALDRGIRLAEAWGREAPLGRWRRERDAIGATVEADGYDRERGIFVQSFGARALDAALLLLPGYGFLAHDDPRMVRTTDAIRAELTDERTGLLFRYRPQEAGDGLAGEEGAFLACSFWLVECLARQGRRDEARALFDRAAATANDLGLFAEEWDTREGGMLGNFPQGLTHLSHIAAALALADGA